MNVSHFASTDSRSLSLMFHICSSGGMIRNIISQFIKFALISIIQFEGGFETTDKVCVSAGFILHSVSQRTRYLPIYLDLHFHFTFMD